MASSLYAEMACFVVNFFHFRMVFRKTADFVKLRDVSLQHLQCCFNFSDFCHLDFFKKISGLAIL